MVFSVARKSPSDYISNHVQPREVITFTDTVANIGNAMNPDDGIFTIPISGLYSFSFSAMSTGNDTSTYIEVHKNDEKQFIISDHNNYGHTNYVNIGYSWTMHLVQNDKIHLYMFSNGLYVTLGVNVWCNAQYIMVQ